MQCVETFMFAVPCSTQAMFYSVANMNVSCHENSKTLLLLIFMYIQYMVLCIYTLSGKIIYYSYFSMQCLKYHNVIPRVHSLLHVIYYTLGNIYIALNLML